MYSKIMISLKGQVFEFLEFSEILSQYISDRLVTKVDATELQVISNLQAVLHKVNMCLNTPSMEQLRKVRVNLPELLAVKTRIVRWSDFLNVFMAQIDQAAVNYDRYFTLQNQLNHVRREYNHKIVPLVNKELQQYFDRLFQTTLVVMNIVDLYGHNRRDDYSVMARLIIVDVFLSEYNGHEEALAYLLSQGRNKHINRTTIVIWKQLVEQKKFINDRKINSYIQMVKNRLVNPEIN